MKYIAKPKLFNNTGCKEFNTAVEAIQYLNECMNAKEGDHQDYVFIPASTSERNLKKSIEEYMGIGKLQIVA